MLSYDIDPARRLVTITCQGQVSMAELLDTQAQLRADSAFHPALALLFDMRQASMATISALQLRSNAATSPFASDSPRAFVVATEGDFGALRMFQTYAELQRGGGLVQVFRDYDEATCWLDQARLAA